MTHRGPFQPLLFCDSVINLTSMESPVPYLSLPQQRQQCRLSE